MSDKSSSSPILTFSDIAEEIKPEAAVAFLSLVDELKRRGINVISFGIGQPDFLPPKEALDAVKRALDEGYTKYISSIGLYDLREKVAEYLSQKYGDEIKPEEVAITIGTKAGIFLSVMALVNPGNEVLMQDPSFPAYEATVTIARGKPVFIPLSEENGYKLKPEDIISKITPKTKGIIVNDPHNPSGSVMTEDEVKKIYEVAKEHNLFIISDEIYEDFVYEGSHTSFLQMPDWRDNVVYLSGFSKTWGMTGLRIGFMAARKELIEKIEALATHTYTCPPAPLQFAGIKALELGLDFFKEIREEYRKRRDAMYEALLKIPGVHVMKGPGTFYLFPNFKEVLRRTKVPNVDELAKRLLYEAHVVVTPGTGFPKYEGEGHLRFSYVLPVDKISEGAEKIKEWVLNNLRS
ncbi:MAG: pyridoxal phosphate-dependent aminotransferase [Sulfolobus sp.]|nr:pyridoxal phosphate-dependent aminotransferase [Sulfolobus sp.]